MKAALEFQDEGALLQAELHGGRPDPLFAPGDLDRAEPADTVSPCRRLRGRLRQGLRQEDARHQVRKTRVSCRLKNVKHYVVYTKQTLK